MILALETATELVGAALGQSRAEAEVALRGRRRHAESLAPAIRFVLEHTGTDLDAVDVVAVDVGPGLFTGIRVGVATAKALAAAKGIGVVPVTSTEALAHAAVASGWDGTVLAVVDARRAQVFAARYRLAPDGGLDVIEGPALYEPADLAATITAGEGPLLVVGDGALRYRAVLEGRPGVVVGPNELDAPLPRSVLAVAHHHLVRGVGALEPAHVEPLYLRDADVKINWVERQPTAVAR